MGSISITVGGMACGSGAARRGRGGWGKTTPVIGGGGVFSPPRPGGACGEKPFSSPGGLLGVVRVGARWGRVGGAPRRLPRLHRRKGRWLAVAGRPAKTLLQHVRAGSFRPARHAQLLAEADLPWVGLAKLQAAFRGAASGPERDA